MPHHITRRNLLQLPPNPCECVPVVSNSWRSFSFEWFAILIALEHVYGHDEMVNDKVLKQWYVWYSSSSCLSCRLLVSLVGLFGQLSDFSDIVMMVIILPISSKNVFTTLSQFHCSIIRRHSTKTPSSGPAELPVRWWW